MKWQAASSSIFLRIPLLHTKIFLKFLNLSGFFLTAVGSLQKLLQYFRKCFPGFSLLIHQHRIKKRSGFFCGLQICR